MEQTPEKNNDNSNSNEKVSYKKQLIICTNRPKNSYPY
jgi:hypothetical protein